MIRARHSIRRWFQFGIVDLLMLTTIVAAAVSLCRAVNVPAKQATPWLFGTWSNGRSLVFLSPDGCYSYNLTDNLADTVDGVGWTIVRAAHIDDAFVLSCGELQLLVRSEWGSDVMDELHENGSIQSQYRPLMRLAGPVRAGAPQGTWSMRQSDGASSILEYRDGELVDCRDSNGWRNLALLNGLRSGRGWPPLGPSDFPER